MLRRLFQKSNIISNSGTERERKLDCDKLPLWVTEKKDRDKET